MEDVIPSASTQSTPSPHSFLITSGSHQHEIVGRTKAIDRAKELSMRFHGDVRLLRDDERVTMTFRRGDLTQYQFETRRKSRTHA